MGVSEAEVPVKESGNQSEERREPLGEGTLRVEEVEGRLEKAQIRQEGEGRYIRGRKSRREAGEVKAQKERVLLPGWE